jgi:hypothetical protein
MCGIDIKPAEPKGNSVIYCWYYENGERIIWYV